MTTITFRTEFKDFVRALRYQRRWRSLLISLFLAACAAVLYVRTNTYTVPLILLAYIPLRPLRDRARWKRIWNRTPSAHREQTIGFDDSGVHWTDVKGALVVTRWETCLKLGESAHGLYLYFPPNSTIIFPKRVISPEDQERIRRLARENIPERGKAARGRGGELTAPEPDQEVQVFEQPRSTSVKTTLYLVGGCAGLVFAVIGFLVFINRPNSTIAFLMTIVPALLGIGGCSTAWKLMRSPAKVAVGPGGFSLDAGGGWRDYSWDEIGWATIAIVALSSRRRLIVYDERGKVLVKIGDIFADFDDLAEAVKQRIGEKKDDTAESIRMKKARRSALLTGAIAAAMILLAIDVAWITRVEQLDARRFEAEGVPATGTIERRFVPPIGVTKRIEYRVTAPDGRTATKNVQVTPEYWDSLEGATTVPIIAVPDEPSLSRLAEGGVEIRRRSVGPIRQYVACSLLGLVMAFCLVIAVLQWKGLDFDIGSMSIKRYGTGR